jgi:hypothetical protein
MNVADCGRLLAVQHEATRIVALKKTPLFSAALDLFGMVTAYLQDGDTFLASGDWVNACAGYYYAFGWEHFGIATGFFTSQAPACPFTGTCEPAPADLHDRLEEKTKRYVHLIATARAGVAPAPEDGTMMGSAARSILLITGVYAEQARVYQASGRTEEALACASYGHGWLDAAVRAGLLKIISNRELFAI